MAVANGRLLASLVMKLKARMGSSPPHSSSLTSFSRSLNKMYSRILLSALLTAASHAFPQGEGEGYPPPPPQVLSTTLSGVLPVLPTVTPGPFAGVETEEGAIIDDGPANPR